MCLVCVFVDLFCAVCVNCCAGKSTGQWITQEHTSYPNTNGADLGQKATLDRRAEKRWSNGWLMKKFTDTLLLK